MEVLSFEMIISVGAIILTIGAVISAFFYSTFRAVRERDATIASLNKCLKKITHQKKSSEVRLGKIGENLAPFTEGWPWDANNFRFLGSPVDGIQFTEDCIYIVEIKTGKSRLSKKQIKCRELVKQGKVKFASFRVSENGIEVKET